MITQHSGHTSEITLIGDPRVAQVPAEDNGEPLVALTWMSGPASGPGRLVRAGVAERLAAAQAALPDGLRLHLSEGFREAADQSRIIADYAAALRTEHPDADDADIERLTSRYVAPLAVAPHVAGAAVDITLADSEGNEIWLGCPLDATPEQSAGACFFAAPDIDAESRERRRVLGTALNGAGLVNYPTEWWHWSYGDRYWAYATGADHACYGPLTVSVGGAH